MAWREGDVGKGVVLHGRAPSPQLFVTAALVAGGRSALTEVAEAAGERGDRDTAAEAAARLGHLRPGCIRRRSLPGPWAATPPPAWAHLVNGRPGDGGRPRPSGQLTGSGRSVTGAFLAPRPSTCSAGPTSGRRPPTGRAEARHGRAARIFDECGAGWRSGPGPRPPGRGRGKT